MKILFAIAGLVAASIVPVRGATLDAAAGLGGLAKAGRWTPLAVSIASDREAIDAELVVTWGDARLRRAVTLSPGGRKTFELYIRTTDPRGAIDVRLQSGGRDLAVARCAGACARGRRSRDRVRRGRRRLAARLQRVHGHGAARDRCRARRAATKWPTTSCGPGTHSGIAPEQDAALRAWRSLEALDASGDLGATPQVSRPLVPRGLPAALTPVVGGDRRWRT